MQNPVQVNAWPIPLISFTFTCTIPPMLKAVELSLWSRREMILRSTSQPSIVCWRAVAVFVVRADRSLIVPCRKPIDQWLSGLWSFSGRVGVTE